jgi:hypothetical protein
VSVPVCVIAGDIAPHGYPDDNFAIEKHTKLQDLCETKFLVVKHLVTDMVNSFPNTKWAFTMGNNDHFPKNTYWPPYILKLGDMFLETGKCFIKFLLVLLVFINFWNFVLSAAFIFLIALVL